MRRPGLCALRLARRFTSCRYGFGSRPRRRPGRRVGSRGAAALGVRLWRITSAGRRLLVRVAPGDRWRLLGRTIAAPAISRCRGAAAAVCWGAAARTGAKAAVGDRRRVGLVVLAGGRGAAGRAAGGVRRRLRLSRIPRRVPAGVAAAGVDQCAYKCACPALAPALDSVSNSSGLDGTTPAQGS